MSLLERPVGSGTGLATGAGAGGDVRSGLDLATDFAFARTSATVPSDLGRFTVVLVADFTVVLGAGAIAGAGVGADVFFR